MKILYRDIKYERLLNFAKFIHLFMHFHNGNACLSKISLSIIVLNSRDWSEIVWLPEILCFKINLAISFIQKIHWNALVRL